MLRPGNLIDRRIADLTGRSHSQIDYGYPPGDPGLFGPDSAVWEVHSDFNAMLCGGISALLLQMLHPLALAGVWDHSTFRQDMLGRLRRTSQFIAVTSYGNRADALKAIERVKQVHTQVVGRTPDGQPYPADDPALLTWVHVAETSRFLAAYLKHRNPGLNPEIQDRYYKESAQIAIALGASEVPQSRREVARYLEGMRPLLRCDERTRQVTHILLNAGPSDFFGRQIGRLYMEAGIDLLPDWSAAQLGLTLSPFKRQAAGASLSLLGQLLRHAVRGTACEKARQRMAKPVAATPRT